MQADPDNWIDELPEPHDDDDDDVEMMEVEEANNSKTNADQSEQPDAEAKILEEELPLVEEVSVAEDSLKKTRGRAKRAKPVKEKVVKEKVVKQKRTKKTTPKERIIAKVKETPEEPPKEASDVEQSAEETTVETPELVVRTTIVTCTPKARKMPKLVVPKQAVSRTELFPEPEMPKPKPSKEDGKPQKIMKIKVTKKGHSKESIKNSFNSMYDQLIKNSYDHMPYYKRKSPSPEREIMLPEKRLTLVSTRHQKKIGLDKVDMGQSPAATLLSSTPVAGNARKKRRPSDIRAFLTPIDKNTPINKRGKRPLNAKKQTDKDELVLQAKEVKSKPLKLLQPIDKVPEIEDLPAKDEDSPDIQSPKYVESVSDIGNPEVEESSQETESSSQQDSLHQAEVLNIVPEELDCSEMEASSSIKDGAKAVEELITIEEPIIAKEVIANDEVGADEEISESVPMEDIIETAPMDDVINTVPLDIMGDAYEADSGEEDLPVADVIETEESQELSSQELFYQNEADTAEEGLPVADVLETEVSQELPFQNIINPPLIESDTVLFEDTGAGKGCAPVADILESDESQEYSSQGYPLIEPEENQSGKGSAPVADVLKSEESQTSSSQDEKSPLMDSAKTGSSKRSAVVADVLETEGSQVFSSQVLESPLTASEQCGSHWQESQNNESQQREQVEEQEPVTVLSEESLSESQECESQDQGPQSREVGTEESINGDQEHLNCIEVDTTSTSSVLKTIRGKQKKTFQPSIIMEKKEYTSASTEESISVDKEDLNCIEVETRSTLSVLKPTRVKHKKTFQTNIVIEEEEDESDNDEVEEEEEDDDGIPLLPVGEDSDDTEDEDNDLFQLPSMTKTVVEKDRNTKTRLTKDARKPAKLAKKEGIIAKTESKDIKKPTNSAQKGSKTYKKNTPVQKEKASGPKKKAPIPKEKVIAPKEKVPVPKEKISVAKEKAPAAENIRKTAKKNHPVANKNSSGNLNYRKSLDFVLTIVCFHYIDKINDFQGHNYTNVY